MDQEPPPYVPHPRRPRPLTLPAYSLASAPSIAQSLSTPYQSEHQYSLENSKGLPWASLHIRSRSPSSHSLPLYFEHDVISGSVSLDLGKPDGIRGVMITKRVVIYLGVQVQAGATGVGQRLEIFMETSQTLWSQPSGKLQASAEILRARQPRAHRLQAVRDHPARDTLRQQHALDELRVPPKLGRRTALPRCARSHTVKAARCPGPQEDPEGWKVLSTVELKGQLFGSRPIALTYTLAIAAPLSFAANTPIPLFLTLCSDDDVAIDLLSSPQAVVVYLIRTLTIFDNPRNWRAPTFDDAMGRAVFWPADEHSPRRGRRRLWGELHLRKGLKQSFTFSKFSVRVRQTSSRGLSFSHVAHSPVCPLFLSSTQYLYTPPRPRGFVPSSPPYQALISEDITVTLRNYPGVTPRSYIPPGTVLPDEGERSGASARFHYTGDMDTFTLQ
ncbi:hypothetical protein EVG20_g9363 [Dentipellis fragilis]|uniref:Arrestin-like N-terminal domain-containing protein n=1 Tax=Dentipellis fragilis TaxID=205917 RepID=A0A4Y9XYU2_9AGAM|nr:hypothetical protein EVG20_g9363 [Dentipellis fragilis]